MSEVNASQRKGPSKVTLAPEEKLLVGRAEAAGMLSISCRALDYLIANKQLAFRRIGARVLISVADLRRFSRADHPERLTGFVRFGSKKDLNLFRPPAKNGCTTDYQEPRVSCIL